MTERWRTEPKPVVGLMQRSGVLEFTKEKIHKVIKKLKQKFTRDPEGFSPYLVKQLITVPSGLKRLAQHEIQEVNTSNNSETLHAN